MKCVFALLLVTSGNAKRSDRTQLESDAMGHAIMDQGTHTSVINQLSAYNTVLTDKVAALQKELRESREKEADMKSWLAEAGKETDTEQGSAAEEETGGEDSDDSSFVDVATAATNPFLAMTPREILGYKKSLCGKKWPKTCASERSATTHATDGFLCGHDNHRIAEMTIYKLAYKFKDAGPKGDRSFSDHARCKQGKCVRDLGQLEDTPILKISQIGALICQWSMTVPKKVNIIVEGKKQEVTGQVIQAKPGAAVEDISLKLNIPIAAVEFKSGHGTLTTLTAFLDAAVATKAIKDALAAFGAVESALHGKVCGHGFTNGPPDAIRSNRKFYQDLVLGRAARVAQVAMAQSGNSNIDTSSSVAHVVHVDTPCAGLVIKLNGAHSDPCLAADWEGAPLP